MSRRVVHDQVAENTLELRRLNPNQVSGSDSVVSLLAEQEQYFDETFDWEAAGIPEDKRPIGEYDKKVLNIIVSPAHATTGYGHRMITFVSNADSYIAK